MVFQIKVNWRVFVLEDARPRIEWFKARIPEATYSHNAEDAISILSNHSLFDVVFLDHDLTFSDVAFPDLRPGSGQRVARFLGQMGFPGLVVIHSVNEAGSRAIQKLLPNAQVSPFGTSDIVHVATTGSTTD